MSSIRGLSDPVRGFFSTYKWEIAKAATLPAAIFFTCISSQKESILDPCTNKTGVVIATIVNTLVLSILHHLIQNKWFNFWEQRRKTAEEKRVEECRSTYATALKELEDIQDKIKTSTLELEKVEEGEQVGLNETTRKQIKKEEKALEIFCNKQEFIKSRLAEFWKNIEEYKGKDEEKNKDLMKEDCQIQIYIDKTTVELNNTRQKLTSLTIGEKPLNDATEIERQELSKLIDKIDTAKADLINSEKNIHSNDAKLSELELRKEKLSGDEKIIKEQLKTREAECSQYYRVRDDKGKEISEIRELLKKRKFGAIKCVDVPDILPTFLEKKEINSNLTPNTDLIPSYEKKVGNFSEEEISKYLWLGTAAGPLSEYVQKVNEVAVYLYRQGFELRGVKADGNCFCSAFLKSYDTLSRIDPRLDLELDKIRYLRNLIAKEFSEKHKTHPDEIRAREMGCDAQWLKASGEGDLLAKALDIPIRVVTVERSEGRCSFSDMVTFPNNVGQEQEWETVGESDKPSEFILIVDLGGHFIAAQKIGSFSASLFNSDAPLELKGYSELVAWREAALSTIKKIDEKISKEEEILNVKIHQLKDLLHIELKNQLIKMNDWVVILLDRRQQLIPEKKETLNAVNALSAKVGIFSGIETFFSELDGIIVRYIEDTKHKIADIYRVTKLTETAHRFKKIPFPIAFTEWKDIKDGTFTDQSIRYKLQQEDSSKCTRLLDDQNTLFDQAFKLHEFFENNEKISNHKNENLNAKEIALVLSKCEKIASEYRDFLSFRNSYFENIKKKQQLEEEVAHISKAIEAQLPEMEELGKKEEIVEKSLKELLKKSKVSDDAKAILCGDLGYICDEIKKIQLKIAGLESDKNEIKGKKEENTVLITTYSRQKLEIEQKIEKNEAELAARKTIIEALQQKITYLNGVIENGDFVDFGNLHQQHLDALKEAGKEQSGRNLEKALLQQKREKARDALEKSRLERTGCVIRLKANENELIKLTTEMSQAQLKFLRSKIHTLVQEKCELVKTFYGMEPPRNRLAVQNQMQAILQTRIELALEKRKINLAQARLTDVHNPVHVERGDKKTHHRFKADEARYKLARLQQEIFRLNEEWRATKNGDLKKIIISLIEQQEDLTYQFFVSKLEYIEDQGDKRDKCKRNANIALLDLMLSKMIIKACRHKDNKPDLPPDFFSDLINCLTRSQKFDDPLGHNQFIKDLSDNLTQDAAKVEKANITPELAFFYAGLNGYIKYNEKVLFVIKSKIDLILHLNSKSYSIDYKNDYENFSSKRATYRSKRNLKKIEIASKESEFIADKINVLAAKIGKMGVFERVLKELKLERITYLVPTGILFALYYFPESLNNTLPFGGILSYSAGLMIFKITTVVYLCLQSSFSKVSSLEPAPKGGFAVQ